MARTPHTKEQVLAKVLAYCQRYRVSPDPRGLPPFPAGKRETRQHREWMTVYRALQRFALRASAAPDHAGTLACPICSRALERELAVPYARRGSSRPASLHPNCAQLARLAETLGPDALTGLAAFLRPRRTRTPP